MHACHQGKYLSQGSVLARLRNPESIHRLWLNKFTVGVAWLGLALAILSPPQGNGILVCWMKASTGLSCPGCGLTRSLSCGLRGMFFESWQYHPMGLLILGFFMATAFASLLSTARRQTIASFMRSKAVLFHVLFLAFVVTFVGFGLARALVEFTRLW